MERGIKNSYHRGVRHQLSAGADSDEVRRIVQRSKIRHLADRLLDLLIDENGCVVLLAAVNNAVTDCADLIQRSDDAGLRIRQCLKNQRNCLLVVLNRCVVLDLAGSLRDTLVGDAAVDSDSLTEALCKELLRLRIDDLELQR